MWTASATTFVLIAETNASRPCSAVAIADGQSLVIGRSDDADIQTADRWVSRRHCELRRRGNQVEVRDLESRHGTYINGEQVQTALLKPGDELCVGLSVFRLAQQPDALH